MDVTDNVPSTLRSIRIIDVRESKTALRPVDRNSEGYKELLASVRKVGVLQTITVRECIDEATQSTFYGLIDGLHRFTAAKDAGFDTIDAKVVKADDFQVLQNQLIANVQRVPTEPGAYSKQLRRMLVMNPALSIDELADICGKSKNFIYDRLSLLDLKEDICKLVDQKQIPLTNAFTLAKLPVEEQEAFKDRAITSSAEEFVPQVNARLKEINDAKRKGRDAAPAEFQPQPRQRKLDELKREFMSPSIGKDLLQRNNIHDPIKAFNLAIRWALHMDDESITAAKAKDEARKKEAADAKAKREVEKEAKAKANVVSKALGVAA